MITKSTYTKEHAQTDGRAYVREVHTDDEGNRYEVVYLAEPESSVEKTMEDRIAILEEEIIRMKAEAAEEAVYQSAVTKVAEYVKENVTAKATVSLTDEELEAYTKRHG
jgi:hypothetical protein